MNALDWFVLLGTMVGIAAYGTWRTRHTDNLNTYLKGNRSTKWGTIGLSIMATQASTITYLSLPGQAYESGIAFIGVSALHCDSCISARALQTHRGICCECMR